MEIEIGKHGMAGDAAILMRVEVEFIYIDKGEMKGSVDYAPDNEGFING